MAKRRDREEQESTLSWYDQPLYDSGDEADPFAGDDDDLPVKARHSTTKSKKVREVGFIGGCFNVFLIAVMALIIFAALGVGIVLAGRAVGIFPQTASLGTAPQEVAQAAIPTNVPPTNENCEPQTWWDARQTSFDYFTTLYDRVTIAPLTGTLDEVRAQMTSQHDTAASLEVASCLSTAGETFTQGLNDAIGAVETFAVSGRPRAASQAQSASLALSTTLVALWDQGVATDPNTPPILNIPRGGNCDATQLSTWATRFRQQWEQVNAILSQTDVAAANPEVVQQALMGLEAVRSNLSAIPAPQCVSRLNQLSVIALNSYINAANATLEGNYDAARESASTYARSHVALNAWLAWLGVEMV